MVHWDRIAGLQEELPWAAPVFALLTLLAILGAILLRRLIRRRYFRRYDAGVDFVRRHWTGILSGQIPAAAWRDRLLRKIVQETALDQLEAPGCNPDPIQRLLRVSGLMDECIQRAQRCRGWRRRHALLTLGRMQLRDGLPVLIEILQEARGELSADTIRAIGRIHDPGAGAAILRRLSRGACDCPPAVLETALAGCFRHHAPQLLARLPGAADAIRPLAAQVLAEIATPGLAANWQVLADDPLPEVRAATARILAAARPGSALALLTRLAADKIWFVRLRAMGALGGLGDSGAIPVLIQGLCDLNRLVRLRAAAALAGFEGREARILRLARHTGDEYALQALVSEMQRSGKILKLVDRLAGGSPDGAAVISGLLRGGARRILSDLMLHHPDPSVRAKLQELAATPEGLPQPASPVTL